MKKRLSIIMAIAVCALMAFSVPAFAGSSSTSEATANAAGGSAGASATGGSANAAVGNTSATVGNTSSTIGNTSAAVGDTSATGVAGDVGSSNVQDVGGITVNNIGAEQKDLTSVNNNGHGYRGFANPADIKYPGLPGYFGNATPGSSFQSCKTSLIYKDTFSTEELKRLAKDSFGSKVIVTPLVEKVAKEDKAEAVKMLLRKPAEGTDVEIVGYITVKATGKNTVSMEILAEAALAARDLGANTIHITAEGVDRELKAFGWGVGLSYTRAQINNDETTGGVAAGGTGISGGSAGYKDMPWFQVFALKVK